MTDLERFQKTIEVFNERMAWVPEEITDKRPSEDDWSLKEIIGHLIDSASNNHQRFVRLQFGDLLDFPAYDGEEWIRRQGYNDMPWKDLTALWYSYNCILIKVIEHMDPQALENVWVKGEEALSLGFLVNDYYRHLEWHIDHFDRRCREVGR